MANAIYDALFAPHLGKETPFLIDKSGCILTHSAFLALASRFAHVLVSQNLQPGDRVVVQIAKSSEALAVYAASVQCGIIFLPLNTAYTPIELAYFIEDAAPKLILCADSTYDELRPIAAKSGANLMTLDADGTGSFARAASGAPDTFPTVARDGADLAAFLYTSGTTGRSKGAMLSHDNLLSNAMALKDIWGFTETDRLLHALPIFHTHGLFVATNVMLACGGSMVFLPSFDADAIILNLPQSTTMMGVPTFYTRLLDDPRLTADLARHMRVFISGSAPLLAETHKAFEARTGHRILERYGMTETNMITSNPLMGERRAGTVGVPLPDISLRIADPENGTILPNGEIGVVEMRGPNVFQGYWQMPQKTKAEFRDDGYFITGDMGLIDKEGYLQIVGRAKDLIITGGLNVYPKEVELLLDQQIGVRESAVIGVPHPDFGEVVIGVIIANDTDNLDANALISRINANIDGSIARFKQPKCLFVESELPRNTMGKVQKNILRERYKNIFS